MKRFIVIGILCLGVALMTGCATGGSGSFEEAFRLHYPYTVVKVVDSFNKTTALRDKYEYKAHATVTTDGPLGDPRSHEANVVFWKFRGTDGNDEMLVWFDQKLEPGKLSSLSGSGWRAEKIDGLGRKLKDLGVFISSSRVTNMASAYADLRNLGAFQDCRIISYVDEK